jgi:hypothetical protein
MVQALALPSLLVVVAGFFSAGTTHIRCAGPGFRSDGTMNPWAGSQALRGLPARYRAAITTVTDGDNHHHGPA